MKTMTGITTTQNDGRLVAAIYERVSSREDPRGQSRQTTENQSVRLQDYVRFKRYQVLKVYTDKQTGKTLERPALQEMLQDSKQKKFDVLIALRLDRLSRSLGDLKDVTDTLRENGIGLEVPDSGIYIDREWKSPVGNMLIGILGAIAEFEDDLISARTKDARERIRENNRVRKEKGLPELKWGRPPWGFVKNPDPNKKGEFVPVPEMIEKAKEVISWRQRRASLREIEKKTGVNYKTASKILKNRKAYTGELNQAEPPSQNAQFHEEGQREE